MINSANSNEQKNFSRELEASKKEILELKCIAEFTNSVGGFNNRLDATEEIKGRIKEL